MESFSRNMRSKCRCSNVLQFTLVIAVSCVLHRPPSQVIHCSVLFLFLLLILLFQNTSCCCPHPNRGRSSNRNQSRSGEGTYTELLCTQTTLATLAHKVLQCDSRLQSGRGYNRKPHLLVMLLCREGKMHNP